MKYNHIKLAIDLVTSTYNITEPFEIQEKIEEDLDMELHINDILKHLKKEDYDTKIIHRLQMVGTKESCL